MTNMTPDQERVLDGVMDGLSLHVNDSALAKARQDIERVPCDVEELEPEQLIDVFMRLASTYQRAFDYGNKEQIDVSPDIKLLARSVGGTNEATGQ